MFEISVSLNNMLQLNAGLSSRNGVVTKKERYSSP